MKLSERDKKIMWHPFTQEKTQPLPIAVSTAKGSYLYDENGKAYLDLVSSWWVNLHGHTNERIAQSIYEQAQRLEHVLFAGFTHEPAVKYCENLSQYLPQTLSRFFYSDNGSTATETALKMAYQYWLNIGQSQRSLFISFDGGYHGDTFGAMSVSQTSGFHSKFKDLCFRTLAIPYPETWMDDDACLEKEEHALARLEETLSQHGNNIAAIIIEPLIQGAKGMRICRTQFLNRALQRIKEHNILIIFDEVMTGFGRTGTNFAFGQLEVTPDFLCLSKGITGGFLPLALTVTTEEIYNSFLSDSYSQSFAHGHTYTANPIACSAAITSLEILLEQTTQEAIKSINKCHKEGLALLRQACPRVTKARLLGTIAAFDVTEHNYADELAEKLLDKGILIRPLGNTIYILPPYIVTASELNYTYEQLLYYLKTPKNTW